MGMSMIYLNKDLVKTSQFSGGERNVVVDTIKVSTSTANECTAFLLDANCIMDLLLTENANGGIYDLTIPYFPYARQDRVCNDGEAFSLKVMANLINSLGCDYVTVFNPHSDVLPGLINSCVVVQAWQLCEGVPFHKYDFIISPDAGAEKKTIKISQRYDIPMLCAYKTRNPKTMEITKTWVDDSEDLQGKSVIIADDICDGGRTFIELAKVLRERGAGDVSLYVTHGIFSRGIDNLKGAIDTVYYNNSLNQDGTGNPYTLITKELS
jgi:ribose-phosphate pyrophosphokinase